MPFKPTWTDEKIALLKQYHGEGLSATEAGALLGVTRNAVIGKWHRLGLSVKQGKMPNAKTPRSNKRKRPNAKTPRSNKRKNGHRGSKATMPGIVWIHELNPASNVEFDGLEDGMCKWPVSDKLFCGAPIIMKRKPYCSIHSAQSGDKVRQNRVDENDARWKNRPTRGRFW